MQYILKLRNLIKSPWKTEKKNSQSELIADRKMENEMRKENERIMNNVRNR